MNTEVEVFPISKDEDLDYLINCFCNGSEFSKAFEFENDELYNRFFDSIGIDVNAFREKKFYFNKEKNIHISESTSGYVWVSTMGLVARSRFTNNKYINALCGQKIVLVRLLDYAIELSTDESSYDINNPNYLTIEQLTPALFHQIIFYDEILVKAYLSINNKEIPCTHKLERLLKLVEDTIFEAGHNDTMIHAYIIPTLREIVHHISSIPGEFREQFVKYDDNSEDTTLIKFQPDYLKGVRDFVEESCIILTDLYDDPDINTRQGLYQRLLEKSKNDEEREKIKLKYSFLLQEKH